MNQAVISVRIDLMEKTLKLACVICLSTSSFATTWTVDTNGKADFTKIQLAIEAAENGDTIQVNGGIYFETIDFLGKEISVIGAGPESTTISALKSHGSVVTFNSGETNKSQLMHFTITGGTGSLFTDPIFGDVTGGGAIFCQSASPSISDCVLEHNKAWGGGGIFIYLAEPVITSCSIRYNEADGHGGGLYALDNAKAAFVDTTFESNIANWGGGATCTEHSDTTFESCIFTTNTTYNVGGGIYIRSRSNPVLTQCSFINNIQINNPYGSGGGACVYGGGDTGGQSYPVFMQCLFSGNSVNGDGGGLAAAYRSHPILTNCTFSQNHAGRSGGGFACVGDAAYQYPSNAIVTNCAFTNNSASDEGGGIFVRSSEPTLDTISVMDNNANLTGGGIHFFESPFASMTDSIICNNAPTSIQGSYADGGGNSISDECILCEGDINTDGAVDVTDLLAIVGNWGDCSDCNEDIDGNGSVDVTDLLTVVGNWGQCE